VKRRNQSWKESRFRRGRIRGKGVESFHVGLSSAGQRWHPVQYEEYCPSRVRFQNGVGSFHVGLSSAGQRWHPVQYEEYCPSRVRFQNGVGSFHVGLPSAGQRWHPVYQLDIQNIVFQYIISIHKSFIVAYLPTQSRLLELILFVRTMVFQSPLNTLIRKLGRELMLVSVILCSFTRGP
jgi:hypothetical protein